MIWIYITILIGAAIGVFGFIKFEDGALFLGIFLAVAGMIVWLGIIVSDMELERRLYDNSAGEVVEMVTEEYFNSELVRWKIDPTEIVYQEETMEQFNNCLLSYFIKINDEHRAQSKQGTLPTEADKPHDNTQLNFDLTW